MFYSHTNINIEKIHIHYSCNAGHYSIIKYLVEKCTPLGFAEYKKWNDIIHLFKTVKDNNDRIKPKKETTIKSAPIIPSQSKYAWVSMVTKNMSSIAGARVLSQSLTKLFQIHINPRQLIYPRTFYTDINQQQIEYLYVYQVSVIKH